MLGSGVVTVVAGPEVLAPLWVVALDFHVRVTEGHLHDVAVRLLHEHDELLLPVGRLALANAAGLVQRWGLFLLLGQDAPLQRQNNTVARLLAFFGRNHGLFACGLLLQRLDQQLFDIIAFWSVGR